MPALVLAAALASIARWRGRNEDLTGVVRPPWRVIGKAFVVSLPALILPFVIRTAVIEGIATATEVSTIGIVYAVIVGLLVYRQFPLRRLYPMLVETAALSGAILLIIGTATAMAWALTQSGFSRQLAAAMTAMPGGGRGVHGGLDRGVRGAGQRAGGDTGDRAVRAVAVPFRQGGGNPRGALRHGGDPGDGNRAIRAAVRGGDITQPAPSGGCRRTPRCGASGPICWRCWRG